jgi:hypothetical protein
MHRSLYVSGVRAVIPSINKSTHGELSYDYKKDRDED